MSSRGQPATGRPGVGRWHPIRSLFGYDRFGVLLTLLVLAFVLAPAREMAWTLSVVSIGVLASALAATGLWEERRGLVVAVGSTGVLGAVVAAVFPQSSTAASLGAVAQMTLLLVILYAVVRRVLAHDRVGVPTILGAIAAYFLIGLSYAWIYLALDGVVDGPVLDPEMEGLPVYYSFVVLSTLGFGDVTPVNGVVQRITAIEAITGQIFLATLVARLVSLFGQPRAQS